MPYRNAPQTLKTLSLQSVMIHFNNLQTSVSELPHVLIEDLLRLYEAKKYLLCNSRIPSQIFIRRKTKQLNRLQYIFDFDIPIENHIHRISQVCKNLTHLNLIYIKVTPDCLENLVSNVPSIKFLNLCETSCTDSVLTAIGTHCGQLESLNVSFCKVTDTGMRCLCLENDSSSRNLKITHLDVTRTCVSWDGCLLVLTNMNILKSFKFNSINAYAVTVPPLRNNSVEGITLGMVEMVASTNQLEMAMTAFCKLREFELVCRKVLTFNAVISSCLTTFGCRLTSLTLCRVSFVDLQLVGVSCPLLEVLVLRDCPNCIERNDNLPILTIHVLFRYLRRLQLHCGNISPLDLRMLLRNCRDLEMLSINQCRSLTDGLIAEIIQVNGLRYLEKLYLSACNSFTPKSVDSLLQIHNPLCELRLYHCANIKHNDNLMIKEFVRCFNLNVKVIWLG